MARPLGTSPYLPGAKNTHPALGEESAKGLRKLLRAERVEIEDGPEPDLQRLALLARRLHEIKHPKINEFAGSFTKFRTTLCYTRDEARGGRVAPIPDYPYLREVDDLLITQTPLFIQKSRRMLISWEVMAFALWLTAGGQDPRWPELMNSTGNRKVIIAARKLEGENGSAEMLSERIRFLVDQFEERGGREKWPEFPEFRWRFDRATASNGSVIGAVPQGADQMRGSGVTLLIMDEIGFWQEARGSIASALQTLQGGGHAVLVTTANRDSYAKLIALDQVRAGEWV